MCSLVVWDGHNLGIRRENHQRQASKERAKEERPILIISPKLSKAPTLAKSFASPPLAAIVKGLGNDCTANPILRLLAVSQLYLTMNGLKN